MSEYPEHDKLQGVRVATQAAGEFLEWLTQDAGYVLAQYSLDGGDERLYPADVSIPELLAQWQGIDRAKLDQEKRQMLEPRTKYRIEFASDHGRRHLSPSLGSWSDVVVHKNRVEQTDGVKITKIQYSVDDGWEWKDLPPEKS